MIGNDDMTAWAYLIDPCFELSNSEGKPLTGGWIEIYQHGTGSKVYAASDFDGTLHPFRIPLDSLGANIVLVTPEYKYDVFVYNRFGSLVMSRYNVTPVGVGSDISVTGYTEITSDGTLDVSVSGGIVVISAQEIWDAIDTVSGAVDSVSGELKELELTVSGISGDVVSVSGELKELETVVSGLSEGVTNVSAALDGKKDVQAPYSASGTNIQTITSISQDEQGVLHVEYSDIQAQNPLIPGEYISISNDVISVTGLPDYSEVSAMIDEAVSAVSGIASVYTDNTLRGDGTEGNPLGIEFPIVAGNNIATGTWNQFGTSFSDSDNGTWAGYGADGITLTDPNGTVNINVSSVSGWDSLQSQIDAVSAMVPEAQVQSDWDEDDPSSKAYIQNKPEEKDLVAGDGIEITVSGTSVIISSDNPSVSGYVTEQELASVSGTLQLEIDTVSSNPRVKIVEYGVDEWSDVVSAMDGVSSGKYDYVVMKYSANGTDLYAPLAKYTPGSAAYFVCPAHGSATTYGYGTRRTTDVYTINSGDMWFDYTVRPFQGRLIGAGNVSVTVEGEDYIVSGTGGSFEQVNADWNATSGVAEILNKPTIPEPQVNSDWNAVSGVAEILNKPTIPAAQVNSDWEAASGIAEILNKPETIEIETVGVSAGSGIAITEVASGIVISCTVTGGPGGSYTAGSGIDITNDVISVDSTVALKTDIPTYTAGQGISVSGGVISVLYTTIDFTGTITCPTCNGAGSVISTDACPTCGGQGGYDSYETCSECNGTGTVSCSTCNGSGHLDEMCTTCGGVGTVTCESCGGAGCDACDYTGYVTCMDCQGTGFIVCPSCGGSGGYPCGSCGGTGGYSTYNTCSECDGTGTIQTSVTCSTCSGTGQIEE